MFIAHMKAVYLSIPLCCLAGAIAAGLLGKWIGRRGAHIVTILGVALAFLLSAFVVLPDVINGNHFNGSVYTWGIINNIPMEVGFLIDPLTAMMMVVVTFVSLAVHIYTIGYMHEGPGYQRFFSYIALFTFAMLMLVMSNNFLQLFFGWEAVGLVSYLLIGFWYTKESAIRANLKAFLVNRVGDLGFLLGIAAIYAATRSLDYAAVFAILPQLKTNTLHILPGIEWPLITTICILLFIGAMGKSAQAPLHVWLPDSMEGPTPISALIHAATMVTAGIFMVARMSPIYEMSETALAVILVIGAFTALFMGLIGVVQNDIKRVVAYSTLSQLGYMMVGLGASAYAAGIFHLMTHAFFKALLFLAAGSVIIAMHHEQDMRKMGGLRPFLPVTFFCAWIGTLALAGIPPFSGFFSKDAIIEAVKESSNPASFFAYVSVLIGVFVTALYSFRMMFMTFYGKPRMDKHTLYELKESPLVVTLPLLALALPSVIAGIFYVEPMLFGAFFADTFHPAPEHDVLVKLGRHYHGAFNFTLHGLTSLPLILAGLGIITAWLCYVKYPHWPEAIKNKIKFAYDILAKKYYFDEMYEFIFAKGARRLGNLFWQTGDVKLIDGAAVNGTARFTGRVAAAIRHLQTGYVYHYAFSMILGLFLLILLFIKIT